MREIGRYKRKPASEIRDIVEAYARDEEPEPRDPWDVDTAVESPQAMETTPSPHKRSGEYMTSEYQKFLNLLEEEKIIARAKFK